MTYDVIVDSISREEWEGYAANFADYSIYQTWPYQQVRAEMDGQEVSRVIIKDERGHVVTMSQVRIKHVKPLRFRIGYVQWAPLFQGREDKIVCSIGALQKLRETYLRNKVDVLRVVPNACNNEVGQTFAEMLQSAGFTHVRGIKPYHTFMLPVDDSEEGIRKRLRKRFRRDLKKAEKAGIEIREGHDEEFCEILKGLYLTSLRRKGFKGLDPQEFIKPQLALSDAEKMNIIVAYHKGEPVTAHLASHLGDTAIALLAASNEHGLSCGSSRLVWYRSAISALNAGMKWYDLGGIDPQKNPTVYEFKRRIGGEECFHIGAFDACSSSHVKILWRVCDKIYRLMK